MVCLDYAIGNGIRLGPTRKRQEILTLLEGIHLHGRVLEETPAYPSACLASKQSSRVRVSCTRHGAARCLPLSRKVGLTKTSRRANRSQGYSLVLYTRRPRCCRLEERGGPVLITKSRRSGPLGCTTEGPIGACLHTRNQRMHNYTTKNPSKSDKHTFVVPCHTKELLPDHIYLPYWRRHGGARCIIG